MSVIEVVKKSVQTVEVLQRGAQGVPGSGGGGGGTQEVFVQQTTPPFSSSPALWWETRGDGTLKTLWVYSP